jgi:hypothetical protein
MSSTNAGGCGDNGRKSYKEGINSTNHSFAKRTSTVASNINKNRVKKKSSIPKPFKSVIYTTGSRSKTSFRSPSLAGFRTPWVPAPGKTTSAVPTQSDALAAVRSRVFHEDSSLLSTSSSFDNETDSKSTSNAKSNNKLFPSRIPTSPRSSVREKRKTYEEARGKQVQLCKTEITKIASPRAEESDSTGSKKQACPTLRSKDSLVEIV